MVKLISFEVGEIPSCRFIGKSIRTKGMFETENPIPAFWQRCTDDGMFTILGVDLKDQVETQVADYSIAGYMADYNEKDQTMLYVVGMFMKADTEAPEGLEAYDVHSTLVFKTKIEGIVFYEVHQLSDVAMKEAGYTYNSENEFCAEVYTEEGYAKPMREGKDCKILDYYIAVKKG